MDPKKEPRYISNSRPGLAQRLYQYTIHVYEMYGSLILIIWGPNYIRVTCAVDPKPNA